MSVQLLKRTLSKLSTPDSPPNSGNIEIWQIFEERLSRGYFFGRDSGGTIPATR
jgi:hypothetical protein